MNYDEFFTDQAGMLPFFKMGIQGEAGSGKSYTMAKVAAGLHRFVKSEKPIVLFDTENTGGFLLPRFTAAKIKTKVRQSRSLTDLSKAMDFCNEGNADILLVDSITHVWENYLDAFKQKKGRNYIQFQDWNELKPTWKQLFIDRVKLEWYHVIFTGRLGDIYQYIVDEETNRRELVKTGIKMRTEKETPYEPDILLLMERYEKLLGPEKEIYRIGTILKDRASVIDGKVFKNPGFKDFQPSIEFVMQNKSETGVVIPGDDRDLVERTENNTEQKREAAKYHERCMNLLDFHAGGQKKEDKARRFKALEYAFQDTSATAIEALGKERLMEGYLKLQEFFSDEKEGRPTQKLKEKLTNGKKDETPTEDDQTPPDEPSPDPPEAGPEGGESGEKEKKTAEQEKFRADVLKLDPVCRNKLCPNKDTAFGVSVDAHHLIKRSQGGDNSVGNGMGHCRHCHDLVENGGEFNGKKMTGKQIELEILEHWLYTDDWRWDGVYEQLRKKRTGK